MSFMGGIEKLSKSAFNTKRSALKNLFKDYGQGVLASSFIGFLS
jgi:hypothetical protein